MRLPVAALMDTRSWPRPSLELPDAPAPPSAEAEDPNKPKPEPLTTATIFSILDFWRPFAEGGTAYDDALLIPRSVKRFRVTSGSDPPRSQRLMHWPKTIQKVSVKI